MDKNIAIEFENVGKQYRLGLVGTGSLQHDINRWWQTSILGKEDPYLKIGEVNDRSTKGHSDYVWALKDISFKVEQGDVVGIIGKNGAGKSTLLKLLSHITAPSTGHIRYKGRIASLLEVGTGFQPEMTARDNIYMNGSIMGMGKSEIDRKLDEIVDFAGIERYLDTPVKRFSSGMTVRLGFAVAAFLEPEILVVDEVLAVGDAEFQKKAIGKMQEVSSGGGRTVLFVSHNMNSIRRLCNHGVVLKNGMLDMLGNVNDCVDYYQEINVAELKSEWKDFDGRMEPCYTGDIKFKRIKILNDVTEIGTDEPISIELEMEINNRSKTECQYSVVFANTADISVLTYNTDFVPIPKNKDTFVVNLELLHHGLPKGKYKVGFNVGVKNFSETIYFYDVVHCGELSMEVKYVNKGLKTEYLMWQKDFTEVLHDKEFISAKVV
jgi:ABC-type polysaccharide/polyol phosphate transport system ATPase subunit